MVKRILKQIAAVFIAVAFISSIFFFMPHNPTNASVNYEILVPQSMISPNSTGVFSTVSLGAGGVYSVVGGTTGAFVQNLLTSNITTMLNLTKLLLNEQNISYNLSGGNVDCLSSFHFVSSLCTNYTAVNESVWSLESVGSSGALTAESLPLSEIKLNSLYQNSTFLLIYFTSTNQSGSVSIPLS